MRLKRTGLRARSFNVTACAVCCALGLLSNTIGCNWQGAQTDAQPNAETKGSSDEKRRPPGDLAQPPPPQTSKNESPWGTDLSAALADAKRLDRPLLIVSILGDLAKRC